MVLLIYDEFALRNSPSSLVNHSLPGQSIRSQIDGRHFGVNRPIDPNALPFCARMMSEGCFCQSSTPVDCSC
jgi:hypothetical protein